MSNYRKEKVLRVPCDCCGIDDPWDFEENNPGLFSGYFPHFEIAPTERPFIDYVLYSQIGCTTGEYGKTRRLTITEKNRYLSIFRKIHSGIDMDDVRLVEYCWYDATEAPDYYDEEYDDFYDEV